MGTTTSILVVCQMEIDVPNKDRNVGLTTAMRSSPPGRHHKASVPWMMPSSMSSVTRQY